MKFKYTTQIIILLIFSSKILLSQYSSGTAKCKLSVNNVCVSIQNNGNIWDNSSDSGSYAYPNIVGADTSNKTIIFSGGTFMSALDSLGGIHVAASVYYHHDYTTGPLDSDGMISDLVSRLWDRIFECSQSDVNDYTFLKFSTGLPVPISFISPNIKEWPGRGNPYLASIGMPVDHDMAPFNDYNHDGIYNPIDGDYPCIKGDKTLFYVMNDAGDVHFSRGDKLGIELKVLSYAYHTSDFLNNTSFYEIKILNRSENNYHDYNFGLIVDPDIGCYQDDYIGCVPSKNVGIAYNGSSIDYGCNSRISYGENPPILGVCMLRTPNNLSGLPMGMTSFGYYNNSAAKNGDLRNFYDYWNRSHGLWNDGSAVTRGGDGTTGIDATLFAYDGDPSDTSQWSECHNQTTGSNIVSDRRFLMTSGPYNLDKNEALEFDYAVIIKNTLAGQIPCPDYNTTIIPLVDSVQYFYDFIQETCNRSVMLSVQEASLTSSNILSVYPNPASDQIFNISANAFENGEAYVAIIDLNGKELLRKVVQLNNHTATMSLDEIQLSKGLYLLQVRQGTQQLHAKLVIED